MLRTVAMICLLGLLLGCGAEKPVPPPADAPVIPQTRTNDNPGLPPAPGQPPQAR